MTSAQLEKPSFSKISEAKAFATVRIPSFLHEEELLELLKLAHRLKVSDLYILANAPIQAKLDGTAYALTSRAIGDAECRSILEILFGAHGLVKLGSGEALDFEYEIKSGRTELMRFRCNVTPCRIYGSSGFEITIRIIHGEPPPLEQIDISEQLKQALMPKDGLVLICGATGHGKSTTIASVLRYRLENDRNQKIITYEAPIEYVYDKVQVHPSNWIVQTEIPKHLRAGFADGTRSALRRAPNIILIGELRDAETIGSALLASQTGHLVYGTAHAGSPGIAFRRIVNSFESAERNGRLIDLISALRTIVVQELVPGESGGRVALREWISFNDQQRERLFHTAAKNIDQVSIEIQKMVGESGREFVEDAQAVYSKGLISEGTYNFWKRKKEVSITHAQ